MRNAILVTLLAFAPALGAGPTTRPADDTGDWLLGQGASATRPAEEAAATQPATDLERLGKARGARHGMILLNNSEERIRGLLATTRDKPLRVWDEAAKEYRDVPYKLVKSIKAEVLWERDEPEWQFKESGSDVKVYTGKTYPARELKYTLTLINGQTLTGGVVAPIYLLTPSGDRVFVLNKRQKGEVGQTLQQLAYVKELHLD